VTARAGQVGLSESGGTILPGRRFVHTTTSENPVMATSLRNPPAAATSLPYRRLSLVLNEKAGSLLAAGKTADLAARLDSAGATTRIIPEGALPDRLRQALEDADAVIVAGGDGTVACAAAVLSFTGVPLGILPGGTMNLLAKDLHLPVGDLNAAADIILGGHIRDIDVGIAGGHVFTCACMLGAPARMGRHREQARLRGPWRQWPGIVRAAAKILSRPRSLRLELSVDGQRHRLKTPSVTITVNPMEDVQGRFFARAHLDGGRLYAYVVHRPGLVDLLRVFVRLALGRPKDPALLVLDGMVITIASASAAIRTLVDGEERLLQTPLTFSVRPKALRVFVPAEHAA
jgi:diacylglycerol kinase family enzyme